MHCPTCGADNPKGNGYCESCGAQLRAQCPRCRSETSPTARFCASCGFALGTPEGERKHATVMFADIVGSTELIAGLDAEQAMERLQPALAEMCEAVQRHGGSVVRTMGDGILAVFGAPRAQEGHALLACETALAMQAAFPAGQGRTMIRIGLHSGEVVSSVLATDPTKEQGAYGLTVHLASRLQEMAKPGGICLTEDCYRLIRPYCDAEPLGRRVLKGFPEPVEIYGLLGLKPAVASQQFRGTKLTSFRGRDRELGLLQRALRSIEEGGETKLIGISGTPGSGKSRLCYEFAEWCRGRSIPVVEARAQLYGHATPLQPMLEFLRLTFRISPSDEAAFARHRIAERVLELASPFEPDLPLIYEFLGVPDNAMPRSQLPPKARHARLLELVRHLVRQGGTTTSVIILEDLHWLDEASGDFVMTLAEAVAGTRTMLVLNYRSAYAAPWMDLPYCEQLPLGELSPEETDALVNELIGDRLELRDIRQRVAERSGGNPFFAEELVRSLAENGLFCGGGGDYWLGTRIGEATLPATVEAVIGARIDRLGEIEKTVLQTAAIIGKEFTLVVLQEVVGPLAANVESVLGRLCEAELIQEQAAIEHRQFAFRHPLMQEVAYASQLKARRGARHAAVAKAMEGFYRDRLDEFAGLLAYHYEAAGQLLDAANYAARAARWVGSTNPAQAIKHWEKVRLLMQGQPRSEANDKLRIMASGQIAWLGWREGMTEQAAKPLVEEALGWARDIDDTMIPLLLFVDARIAGASGGAADIYVERVKNALSLLKQGGSAGRNATLNCALSQAYGWAGLLNEALAANDAALQGLPEVDEFDDRFLGYSVEHWVMSLRGRILVRLGRFAEAEQWLAQMLSIEHTLHDPTVRFIPHLGYVDLAWYRNDPELAEKHASRIVQIANKSGGAYLQVYAFAYRGIANSLAGNFAAAEHDFIEGLEFVQKAKASMSYEPEIIANLADCYYRMEKLDSALDAAGKAITAARQRCTRLAECRASIICGAALLARDGALGRKEAEGLFRRAEDLIAVTGARIYEPLLMREKHRWSGLVGRPRRESAE